MPRQGRILALDGNRVSVQVDFPALMFEAVEVGESRAFGEVVRIEEKKVDVRLYADADLHTDDLVVFSGDLARASMAEPGEMRDALGRFVRSFVETEPGLGLEAEEKAMPCLRLGRTLAGRVPPSRAFSLGVRILDAAFPIRMGESAFLCGASGAGKTALMQAFARNAEVEAVVFVFCFARGSEVVDFAEGLSSTEAARTTFFVHGAGEVAEAAEIAVLNGVAVAECYRDAGKSVLLLVDGFSDADDATVERLLSRMAACAGCADRAGTGNAGSITVIVAAQEGLSGAWDAVWKLDTALAEASFFPALDTRAGFSHFRAEDPEQEALRQYLMKLLLDCPGGADPVTPAPLAAWARLRLDLLKLFYVRQDLYSTDIFSSILRTWGLLRFFKKMDEAVLAFLASGGNFSEIVLLPLAGELIELRSAAKGNFEKKSEEWLSALAVKTTSVTAPARRSAEEPVEPPVSGAKARSKGPKGDAR